MLLPFDNVAAAAAAASSSNSKDTSSHDSTSIQAASAHDRLTRSLCRRPLRLCAIALTIAALVLIVVFVPKKHDQQLWGYDYVRSSYDWASQHKAYPVASLIPLPPDPPLTLPNVQHAFPDTVDPDREAVLAGRRDQVKAAFVKSWTAYKSKAWMRDEISPVSGLPKDTLGGWAATLVDSLDTLWIMDLRDEFYDAVAAAATLDFGYTSLGSCNFFEVTIRHLGGLLAAFDLSKERVLLEKATDLGEMLYMGFDTPTQFPPFLLSFADAKTGHLTAGTYDPAAAVTSFGVEFTRLSQLTGNNKYYDAQARLAKLLDEWQNRTAIPGLWPVHLNLQKLELDVDTSYSLGAMGDSMYEYLPKMHAMLGGLEKTTYEKLYRDSMAAVIKHIMFQPMTRDQQDILFLGTNYVVRGTAYADFVRPADAEMEHLTCFGGGMFALGGRLFDIPEHLAYAEKLTKGCVWAYDISKVGIAPEQFTLLSCAHNSSSPISLLDQKPCEWDATRWYEEGNSSLPLGFKSVADPRYLLRPEAIESVFIMYRVTGDKEYQEMAWRMFEAVVAASETKFGYSTVEDVTVGGGELADAQESFWLSETLKYFYLVFASPDLINLDDYILNTEAHPLLRPKAAAS